MNGLCGANCKECELLKNKKCIGCLNSKGCPFGEKCFIANYIEIGGKECFETFKKRLINEFNELKIDGMKKIDDLYPLNGSFINLDYTLPNGKKVKFLDDNKVYLGNQVGCEISEIERCFGLVANMDFLLVCEYDSDGNNSEILIYKKR